MQKVFAAIAGNIGSGKTTLTKRLTTKYSWEPYYESVTDNPYLADFYTDMPRWSFPLQVFFLSKRFEAHQKISLSPESSIQDRTIYEDYHIFARTLLESEDMTKRDYENYLQLYNNMIQFLKPPDLLIYLRRSVSCLEDRIRQRGRDYEKNIPIDYLEKLGERYDEWIENYKIGNVLTIDADNLDLKENEDDFEEVCSRISKALGNGFAPSRKDTFQNITLPQATLS